jgi:hypothetical protein
MKKQAQKPLALALLANEVQIAGLQTSSEIVLLIGLKATAHFWTACKTLILLAHKVHIALASPRICLPAQRLASRHPTAGKTMDARRSLTLMAH